MVRRQYLLTMLFASISLASMGSFAYAKAHQHHSGQQLLGDKIRTNGEHVIDKAGKHSVAVRVVDGKVAGLHVKQDNLVDVPVKKYKANKKFAQADDVRPVSFMLAQSQDLGMTYIGYSFIDEYGNEQIYWFPYEMVLDGYTGAVDYVPLS